MCISLSLSWSTLCTIILLHLLLIESHLPIEAVLCLAQWLVLSTWSSSRTTILLLFPATKRGNHFHFAMATKPIILPDSYSGESNWEQWLLHYNDSASVNSWDDDKKLSFLKVRPMGRAQAVIHRLPDGDKNSFDAAVKALEAHFEPKGKRGLYLAEFTTCTKKLSESWMTYNCQSLSWFDCWSTWAACFNAFPPFHYRPTIGAGCKTEESRNRSRCCYCHNANRMYFGICAYCSSQPS